MADDGAIEQSPSMGGAYGTAVDLEGQARNQASLINRYRQMATQPECDMAIDDIINEMVDMDWKSSPVQLNFDDVKESKTLQDRISDEFDELLMMVDFQNKGYDMCRRWYVDGQSYHQLVIDHERPSDGIKRVVETDPRKIRPVRKQKLKKADKVGGAFQVPLYMPPEKYYIYNPSGMTNDAVYGQRGVKIAKDSIAHTTSGIVDPSNKMVLGHMHKAIKPLNNLRHMEDSSVIYRLARAPERRLFYLDVGNLPKLKAEQYLRTMMNKYKNRLIYDANTGAIRDDRRFHTMLEDYWLPRREGGKGTEVSTLPGGENLGQITDIEYFQAKLYKALNVPLSRLSEDNAFNIGRPSEITRDEVKFNKFIVRLRNRYAMFFDTILGRQLILKGVLNSEQWKRIRETLSYDWRNDNHFAELKETEILRERISAASEADPLVGRYVSERWVRTEILRQTDEELEEIDQQKDEEAARAQDMGDFDGDGMPDGPSPEQDAEAQGMAAAAKQAATGGDEEPKGKKKDNGAKSERGRLISRKRKNKRHALEPEKAG